jgi:hypothetical protein
MDDGRPMEPKLAQAMEAADPVPESELAILGRFFTDQGNIQRITLIVNTDAAIVVACSEAGPSGIVDADCSGMPKLHLFLVKMQGLNPREIAHVATEDTPEVDKFSIWMEGPA